MLDYRTILEFHLIDDDAWMRALAAAFPRCRDLGTLRYTADAQGKAGNALRAAYLAYERSRIDWRRASDRLYGWERCYACDESRLARLQAEHDAAVQAANAAYEAELIAAINA